jgi:hypothetical protein
MIEILAGLATGLVLAWIVRFGTRLHRSRLKRMAEYRAQFADIAEDLVSNDQLDDAHLGRIRRMANDINDVSRLHILMRVLPIVERELRAGKLSVTPSLECQEWSGLLYNYFMALTYLRFGEGRLVRAMLTKFLDPRTGPRNTEVIDLRVHQGSLQPA